MGTRRTSILRSRLSRLGLSRSGAAFAAACCAAACSAPPEAANATYDGALDTGKAEQAIVGGEPDRDTDAVLSLTLELPRLGLIGHCSGTLIAPNLVLTAHHCVAFTGDGEAEAVNCDVTQFTQQIPARYILVSDAPERPASAADRSFRKVSQVRTIGGSADLCGLDVALLVLESNYPASVLPIAPRLRRSSAQAELFSAIGFGLTDPEDLSSDGVRRRADDRAVLCGRGACGEGSRGAIRDSEWASLNAPVCSGDSGGPALDESGQVFGVASRGDEECEIAIYSDVSSFADFIADTAIQAADLGNYAAPSWAVEVSSLPPVAPDFESSADSACAVSSRPSTAHARAIGSMFGFVLVGLALWRRRTAWSHQR